MTALEFLRSEPVLAMLERASEAAGVPASLHYLERNQEGPKVAGWGQCTACREVHETAGGGTACRLSRSTASGMALRQDRPMPFVCHLGFACVSVPVLPGEGYVLTLGPYCPMEEQRSLEDDVRSGFASLGVADMQHLAGLLEDVHRAPASAVPAVAEWTVETIRTAWEQANLAGAETQPAPDEPGPAQSRGARIRAAARPAVGAAEDIAAAIAAGSWKRARALFIGELEEFSRAGGKGVDARRALVISIAGAALVVIVRAGVPASAAWSAFPVFVAALAKAESDGQMASAALEAFAFLRKSEAREKVESKLPQYPELFAAVKDRLLESVTLEEIASHLGETPSAISHRLKRKFGMSYSDYIARLRIDKAKELFRRTGLSVSEVAQRVGVGDQSNFARLFRKVEGMTPASYRKQYGKKQ